MIQAKPEEGLIGEWRERLVQYGWFTNLPLAPTSSYQSPARQTIQVYGAIRGHWIDVYGPSKAWTLKPALDQENGLKGEGTTTESLEAALMAVAIFEALP